MSALARTASRPGAGRPLTVGSLVRLIAPTCAWIVLGVQVVGVALIAGHAALRALSGESLALSPTSVVLSDVGVLALLTVLAGFVRAAGCWGVLRGAIDAGASRHAVRRAALGVLGLLVLLQLPAGIILVVTAARTPGVVVTAPGGSAGLVLDYAVTCLAVNVLGVLARATWRGRPTVASLTLLAALVVGSPTILGDQGLLGVLQWLLPSTGLLTIPIGEGLAHLGWALLVGPGVLTWLITRWEPGR